MVPNPLLIQLTFLVMWKWSNGAVIFARPGEGAVRITALTDPYLDDQDGNSTIPIEMGVGTIDALEPDRDRYSAITKQPNRTINNPTRGATQTTQTKISTRLSVSDPPLIASSHIVRKSETSRKYLYTTEPSILYRAQNGDDEEEPGFKLTTEKLAYILIGSCCGLSILCLVIVATSVRCREHYQTRLVEKKWPRPSFDSPSFVPVSPSSYHYTFARRATQSGCASCRCTCGTWSLGPSNLDSNAPLFGNSNKSTTGTVPGKKMFGHRLPFGAGASTLHFSGSNLNSSRPSYNYSIPRSCHCQQRTFASRATPYKSEDSTSTSSESSESTYDPDFHPQCTCIEPPRRLMEWDVSPDSLETSDETDGPSWQACSYLVDTLHRHHRNPTVPVPSSANRNSGPPSARRKPEAQWTNVTTNPLRNLGETPVNTGPRGVSWTSNSERLI